MRKLLVANRGEIARRVFRSAHALGIATVAVFSDPDADAPHVRDADEAVALGGAAPADSYLRIDLLLDAARRTGADAIHPGYGFLAEDAGFARAVLDAGLIWVGPPPAAIELLGSKVAARERMAAAGVPVLPGETLGAPADDLAAAAARVGLPLLVKASAGGGGKGMRLVESAGALAGAVDAARREAQAAFGDGTVFLERYAENPRHVEIQILGDTHGNVVSLHERECSIQRRHQKILEESPSPALDADLRARMGAAAVAAGEAAGYVGAGTVEFLLLPGDSEFFFLEVNTRLQVEHPVTEAVLGIDLVRAQLEIAGGGRVPEVPAAPSGHAIEVRLYAEDPANDFLPVTGTLARFEVPEGVRVDTGVESGSEISPYYDPMIAKLIVHAPTRTEAAARLARALRAAKVQGLVTNRDFLVGVLEHPAFLAGDTDTGFLARHHGLEGPLLDAAEERAHAAAAALALQAGRRASARVLRTLPSGWRNVPSADQEIVFEGPRGALPVAYRFERDGTLGTLSVAGESLDAAPDDGAVAASHAPVLHGATAEHVELSIAGVRRTYRVHTVGDRVWVSSGRGELALRALPRHPNPDEEEAPGSLVSPMPGAVVRVAAEAGAHVERGAVLVVIEAMKMEHEITAPATGTVSEVRVSAGEQVEAGAVLAVIEESD